MCRRADICYAQDDRPIRVHGCVTVTREKRVALDPRVVVDARKRHGSKRLEVLCKDCRVGTLVVVAVYPQRLQNSLHGRSVERVELAHRVGQRRRHDDVNAKRAGLRFVFFCAWLCTSGANCCEDGSNSLLHALLSIHFDTEDLSQHSQDWEKNEQLGCSPQLRQF